MLTKTCAVRAGVQQVGQGLWLSHMIMSTQLGSSMHACIHTCALVCTRGCAKYAHQGRREGHAGYRGQAVVVQPQVPGGSVSFLIYRIYIQSKLFVFWSVI